MSLVTEFVSLLTDFKKVFAREIIYGAVGKIESFDKQKMRADVQPLFYSTSKGARTNHAIIPKVPVQFLFSGGFYVRPHYQKGDMVWLGYATFNIENQLKGNFESTEGATNHEHALSVITGLAKSNWQAPNEFSKDGLLVGHKDSGLWLQITDSEINGKGTTFNWDGDINATGKIHADDDISTGGKLDADGEVTAHAGTPPVKVTLSNHNHQLTVNPGILVLAPPPAGTGSTTSSGSGSTQSPTPGA